MNAFEERVPEGANRAEALRGINRQQSRSKLDQRRAVDRAKELVEGHLSLRLKFDHDATVRGRIDLINRTITVKEHA